jgi:hypothetical protein
MFMVAHVRPAGKDPAPRANPFLFFPSAPALPRPTRPASLARPAASRRGGGR